MILHDDKTSTQEALQALVMRYKQVFAQQPVPLGNSAGLRGVLKRKIGV
jgi:hypothetical protein